MESLDISDWSWRGSRQRLGKAGRGYTTLFGGQVLRVP